MPQLVTHNHDWRGALANVLRCKWSPHREWHAQNVERFGRHHRPFDPNRVSSADQSRLKAAVAREHVERLLPRPEIDEVPDGDVLLRQSAANVTMLDEHEVVR